MTLPNPLLSSATWEPAESLEVWKTQKLLASATCIHVGDEDLLLSQVPLRHDSHVHVNRQASHLDCAPRTWIVLPVLQPRRLKGSALTADIEPWYFVDILGP